MPRLTKTRIATALPRETTYVLWESSLPGFGVRVYPSGRKSYMLHTRQGGRQRVLTIGPVALYPLALARQLAEEILLAAVYAILHTGETTWEPDLSLTEYAR